MIYMKTYLIHHGVKGQKWGVRHDKSKSSTNNKNTETTYKQRKKMWNDLESKKNKAFNKSYNKDFNSQKAYKAQKKVINNFIKKHGEQTYKKMNREQNFREAVAVGSMMAGTFAGYALSQKIASKRFQKNLRYSLNKTIQDMYRAYR